MKKNSFGIYLGGTKVLIALVEKNNGKILNFVKKKIKEKK